MTSPFATAADVAAKWRPLAEPEQAHATVLLEEASALIRRRLPGIDTWIADGTLDAVLARRVATNAVLRVLRNPDGTDDETTGQERRSWSGIRATGEVTITDHDVANLQPSSTGDAVGGTVVGSVGLVEPTWMRLAARPNRYTRRRW